MKRTLSSSQIQEYATANVWHQREEAAEQTKSEKLLRHLAQDTCWVVRVAVARNKHTPLDVSIHFLTDIDMLVRDAAQKIDFPADMLAGLANNRSAYVRKEAAQNRMTDISTLVKLTTDRAKTVREIAVERLAALQPVAA